MPRWLLLAGVAPALAGIASCHDASTRIGPTPIDDGDRAVRDRVAYVAERQSEGDTDPRYALRARAGVLVAEAPRSEARVDLGPTGMTLRRERDRWRAVLTTARYGCAGALARVERSSEPSPRTSPNRAVVAARAGAAVLLESYAHGPLGVEQAFVLEESPCADPRELVIEERVDGLEAGLRSDRRGADLRDARGVVRAHYTDLWATDARGAVLPAWMDATAGGVAIHVDVRRAKFPILVDPLAWFEVQKLVATGGATDDLLGDSVRISGDTAIVGAPAAAGQAGAAYAFVLSAGSWVEQQALVPDDAASQQLVGFAVGVAGDTAVVGAPGEPGSAGAAYVFARSSGVWTQQQQLLAPPGQVGFGVSVAISGSTVLVGATNFSPLPSAPLGAVYVFTQSGGTWTLGQTIESSDETTTDQFGVTLDYAGSTAIVGAPLATVGTSTGQGAVYVFTQSGSTFTQQQKLVASDGVANDQLGESLAIAGSTALVGVPTATVGGNPSQGAVYVFELGGGTFTQQQKLVASDGATGGDFGRSIALSGGTAVVGSTPQGAGVPPQGQAYVFVQASGSWTQSQKLLASDGAPGDQFGGAVATDGAVALVSAPGATIGGNTDQGAVYVEELLAQVGTMCTADAQCGSGHCSDGYCCDTACSLQCQACDVPGTIGTCSTVNGNPRGTRAACTSQNGNCGGTCNGMDDAVCTYPPGGTACGTSCTGVEETDDTCDGFGTCVTGEPAACRNNFQCDPSRGACYASCTENTQCASGYLCAAGACAPGTVCLDGHTSQGPTGAQDCGAYSCASATGLCNTTCTTVDDCSAPSVCDFSGACVAPPNTSVLEGGCSVGVAGRDGRVASLVALPLLALGASLRNRASRRRRARPQSKSSS